MSQEASSVNCIFTPKQLQNFWSKVNKDGPTVPHMKTPCWLWMAGKSRKGYGAFEVAGKAKKAHRMAWTAANGQIPDGLWVLHKCDVRNCVNPDHLFLGTHQDNMDDMIEKGRKVVARGERNGARLHPERMARGDRNGARLHPERMPRGEAHGNAKFTAYQVRALRSRYAQGGVSQRKLAKEFGVSQAIISCIIRMTIWKHV